MQNKILIAQITDTHIVPKNNHWKDIVEARTSQRLKKVIMSINSLSPKPDLVIHTGDITDKGDLDSYLHAKELLEELEIEYFLTCGNHDNFNNLKQVFSHHNYFLDHNFAHYVIDYLSLRIIVMDTQVAGESYGKLCEIRKEWLINVLQSSQKDTILFLHHFPVRVKDEIFNQMNLLNSTELENIISQYNNVLGLYCGHSHYGAAGLFSGKMCWLSPSTAPVHIFSDNKCIGLNFASPCYACIVIIFLVK